MNLIRSYFSGPRNRLREDGVDLDLTRIHRNLIAMSFPASGIEKVIRNDINEVAGYLDRSYPDSYQVFNLSGRVYDYEKFHRQVKEYFFPDHFAPSLKLLWEAVREIDRWVEAREDHVAVVHCLAGKGRTGLVLVSYMLYAGIFGRLEELQNEQAVLAKVQEAAKHFRLQRGQGVENPSQLRYIYYFAEMLRRERREAIDPSRCPRFITQPARVRINQIILDIRRGQESFNGSSSPVLIVEEVQPGVGNGEVKVLFNSGRDDHGVTYPSDGSEYASITFQPNRDVKGDFTILGFHHAQNSRTKMFRAQLNTNFLGSGPYVLETSELDNAMKNAHLYRVQQLIILFDPHPGQEPQALTLPVVTSSVVREDVLGRPMQQQAFRVRKTGKLIKMGGQVASWKERFFNLRDGHLKYYESEREVSPLDQISLQDKQIRPINTNMPDIPSKYRGYYFFSIAPRGTRCTGSNRTYFLGAPTSQERDDWVNALQEANLEADTGYSLEQNVPELALKEAGGRHSAPSMSTEQIGEFPLAVSKTQSRSFIVPPSARDTELERQKRSLTEGHELGLSPVRHPGGIHAREPSNATHQHLHPLGSQMYYSPIRSSHQRVSADRRFSPSSAPTGGVSPMRPTRGGEGSVGVGSRALEGAPSKIDVSHALPSYESSKAAVVESGGHSPPSPLFGVSWEPKVVSPVVKSEKSVDGMEKDTMGPYRRQIHSNIEELRAKVRENEEKGLTLTTGGRPLRGGSTSGTPTPSDELLLDKRREALSAKTYRGKIQTGIQDLRAKARQEGEGPLSAANSPFSPLFGGSYSPIDEERTVGSQGSTQLTSDRRTAENVMQGHNRRSIDELRAKVKQYDDDCGDTVVERSSSPRLAGSSGPGKGGSRARSKGLGHLKGKEKEAAEAYRKEIQARGSLVQVQAKVRHSPGAVLDEMRREVQGKFPGLIKVLSKDPIYFLSYVTGLSVADIPDLVEEEEVDL